MHFQNTETMRQLLVLPVFPSCRHCAPDPTQGSKLSDPYSSKSWTVGYEEQGCRVILSGTSKSSVLSVKGALQQENKGLSGWLGWREPVHRESLSLEW